jgi:CrcB protein
MVGAGGCLGAIGRYLVGGLVHRLVPLATFPYGTLTANVVGCLVIGFLGGLSELHGVFSGRSREFLFIGVLGGFTTFSSFAFETLTLTRGGETISAIANIALHLVCCLAAVWVGSALSRAV